MGDWPGSGECECDVMTSCREIKSFIGFDEQDAERLEALSAPVESRADEVVDAFYAALQSNVHTRAVFEDDAQIERLKRSFHDWLLDAFERPYGPDYCEAQRQIGRVHQEVGVEPEYVFGAMNVVRERLIEIFGDSDADVPLARAISSLDKLLDLNMTLMVEAYWESVMEEKEEVGTQLASFMAHELRNPLNAIELNMTLLQRRFAETFDDPEEYRSMFDAMRSEIDRIENLTRDIKEFAQPVSVEPSWHDLGELVRDLEASHGAMFDAAEIAFRTDVDEDVDIYCDADRMKQVFINLLKNSVEAIDGEGEVVFTAEQHDDHWRIRVVDDGSGLEAGSQKQLFELFYTTKASGTGLGLPIAKKIVEGHGGSISVRSSDGGGTTVEVVLPRPAGREAIETSA